MYGIKHVNGTLTNESSGCEDDDHGEHGAYHPVPVNYESLIPISLKKMLEFDKFALNDKLSKLDSFVPPGGSAGAALLHVARTVTRRAERSTWVAIHEHREQTNPVTATYLNRLSDLLFILARGANAGSEPLWQPGRFRAES